MPCTSPLSGLDHSDDRLVHALELRQLSFQLFPARFREFVITSPAVSGRPPPLRGPPSSEEHALECRVERAFFDLQNVLRNLLDRVGDLKAVHLSSTREGFQDQHIKCPWWNLISHRIS